jgi:hypothetical protein
MVEEGLQNSELICRATNVSIAGRGKADFGLGTASARGGACRGRERRIWRYAAWYLPAAGGPDRLVSKMAASRDRPAIVFIMRSFRVSVSVITSVRKCQHFGTFMGFYRVAIGIYGVLGAPEAIVDQMA